MYLVIVMETNSFTIHSMHTEETRAVAWAQCKCHDGYQASVLFLDDDSGKKIADMHREQKKKPKNSVDTSLPI